jgi:hypothetical protein
MSDSLPVPIFNTTSVLSSADYCDHFLARIGWKRTHHLVVPGLYALGTPNAESPVFVSANYTLSFDALRSALMNWDAYILVLDTKGINVWCAAGEGTFGTEELINRLTVTRLSEVIRHRHLILPQLGAPGVSAFEVKRRSGFSVEFGPVRSADLPTYLKNHQATVEMRQVRFDLLDRLVLIPIELVHTLLPMLAAAFVLFWLHGWLAALSVVAAVLAGTVLFPILLPWIPGREFSPKGYWVGLAVILPIVLAMVTQMDGLTWTGIARGLAYLLFMPALTAYLALNFTGSTTFTSRSGVKQEIYSYIPVMAWMGGLGLFFGMLSSILAYWRI